MKKRIAIYFTGGTISMKYDAAIGAAMPALSGQEILDNVPGANEIADLEVIDFGRFPGPHMILRLMMDLSARVRASVAREEISGIVITHGTDTLEETAYLLDLTVETINRSSLSARCEYLGGRMGWPIESPISHARRILGRCAGSGCDGRDERNCDCRWRSDENAY